MKHLNLLIKYSDPSFLPPRDLPPESPTSLTLQHSSGSMSASAVDDLVVTVGEAEVKLRKSKKKKKRSSMIFISEERERTNTLDCKRVRMGFNERYSRSWDYRGETMMEGDSEWESERMLRWYQALFGLCLTLAVQETGVPQWHQLVWAEWRKCVVDSCQLQITSCHHRWIRCTNPSGIL